MKKNNLNPMVRLEGKSFLFNLMAVLVNLVGLTLLVMSFHKNFVAQHFLLAGIGTALLILSIAVMVIFHGRFMMNGFARVMVGGLFIVSGLVKANDPLGFSYKLEEYFEDGALAFRIKELFGMPEFSLEFFIDWALPISVAICILEIVLGVFTILGRRMKTVSVLIFGLMLFFTFLTWHTANCDGSKKFRDRDTYGLNEQLGQLKMSEADSNDDIQIVKKGKDYVIIDEYKLPQCVDDCGCFGDALKGSVGRSLTPAESMWKDIVLLYFSIWLLIAAFKRGRIEKEKRLPFVLSSLVLVLVLCAVFGWYFPFGFTVVAIFGSIILGNSRRKWLSNDWAVGVFLLLLTGLMVLYVLAFDPIKDYRPYAVGSKLTEKMNDGFDGVYQNLMLYENIKTKEQKEYDAASKAYLDSKIWEDKSWVYVEMKQYVIEETRIPSITAQFNPYLPIGELLAPELSIPFVRDFLANSQVDLLRIKSLSNESEMDLALSEYTTDDYTAEEYLILDTLEGLNPNVSEISLRDYLVQVDRVYIIVAKNLNQANWNKLPRYKDLFAHAQKMGIPMVMLTSSNRNEMNNFRKSNNWNIPIFLNDETELKAITRSNPSLMYLEKGIVKAKFPHRSTPSVDWINNNLYKK